MDERVAQYFRLDFYLFWTILHRHQWRYHCRLRCCYHRRSAASRYFSILPPPSPLPPPPPPSPFLELFLSVMSAASFVKKRQSDLVDILTDQRTDGLTKRERDGKPPHVLVIYHIQCRNSLLICCLSGAATRQPSSSSLLDKHVRIQHSITNCVELEGLNREDEEALGGLNFRAT